MKKSSLFSLFVGAILVVVVAEFMVDGYLQVPASGDASSTGAANVVGDTKTTTKEPVSPLTTPSEIISLICMGQVQ
jgi:hypothetical protein